MIAIFKTHVIIAVTCFACDDNPKVVTLFDQDVLPGERAPEVHLPVGWMHVDGRTFCERHKVSVFHESSPGKVVIDFPRQGKR